MIVLTSNGIANKKLQKYLSNVIIKNNFKKAILVVTADNEYKEKNWNVSRLRAELESLDLEVSFFDFDTDHPDDLFKADVIEFNGGNPYYLIDRIRKANISKKIESFIDEKIFIGISAVSLVFQSDLRLINELTPEMNFLELTNLDCLNLVPIEILPHYNKLPHRFQNLEKLILKHEARTEKSIIRLHDNEAIVFGKNFRRDFRNDSV